MSLAANFRLAGRCVAHALDEAARRCRLPRAITVVNGYRVHLQGPGRMGRYARRQVRLHATRQARRQRVDRVVEGPAARRAVLNVNEFIAMHDSREKLKAWQDDYHHCRSRGSLGHLTPSEFATMHSEQPKEAAKL